MYNGVHLYYFGPRYSFINKRKRSKLKQDKYFVVVLLNIVFSWELSSIHKNLIFWEFFMFTFYRENLLSFELIIMILRINRIDLLLINNNIMEIMEKIYMIEKFGFINFAKTEFL